MSKDSIAVVKVHYALEEAYRMGYYEFEGFNQEGYDDPVDLSHFKESARWANIVAPKLRAMAGYGDKGMGTYAVERQVAVIEPGCEEDEPAKAELWESWEVKNRLIGAFDDGCIDSAKGNEQEPPEW